MGEPLLLLYTPIYGSHQTTTPASVLAVTARGWVLAEEPSPGAVIVVVADFAHTLGVELIDILLFGRLEIAYSDEIETKRAYITFNTVTIGHYLDAINLILSGMQAPFSVARPPTVTRRKAISSDQVLPQKFRSALRDFTPQGEHVRSLYSWPTAAGRRRLWFHRDLVPAGIMVLTEATLIVVQERLERSRHGVDYGRNTTFAPLHRVRKGAIQEIPASGLTQLIFHISAWAGAEDTLLIDLPSASAHSAETFMKQLTEIRGLDDRQQSS